MLDTQSVYLLCSDSVVSDDVSFHGAFKSRKDLEQEIWNRCGRGMRNDQRDHYATIVRTIQNISLNDSVSIASDEEETHWFHIYHYLPLTEDDIYITVVKDIAFVGGVEFYYVGTDTEAADDAIPNCYDSLAGDVSHTSEIFRVRIA